MVDQSTYNSTEMEICSPHTHTSKRQHTDTNTDTDSQNSNSDLNLNFNNLESSPRSQGMDITEENRNENSNDSRNENEVERGVSEVVAELPSDSVNENDNNYFIRFANGLMNETNSLVSTTMERLGENNNL